MILYCKNCGISRSIYLFELCRDCGEPLCGWCLKYKYSGSEGRLCYDCFVWVNRFMSSEWRDSMSRIEETYR